MKPLFKLTLFCFLVIFTANAQNVVLPNIDSLAKRQTPAWFNNAKLGIFIHWGLYSVPAWAKTSISIDTVSNWKHFYLNNPYAEWYLNSLRIIGSETQKYHQLKYGQTYDYYTFKDSLLLKSATWKANQWITLFKNIGAKYIVITAKHHDGFMMYPSTVPNPFYKQNEICSQRDFIGEIQKSAKSKGLKFGIYYSGGLDWTFNYSPITNLWPDLFQSMPNSLAYTAYADAHLHEIIYKYKPDILWNDVNYPKNGDVLGIFSELFNINKNAIINDRWGQYQQLSNFTTPEYKILDTITSKEWETCRGLGNSFGFNQLEDEKQTISSSNLVKLLIEIVSKNGNLLLNIGPKQDGSIPDIQLKRLNDLGKWLKINGEGIFETKPWIIDSYKNSLGLNVRFTKKDNQLYLFILNLPSNKIVNIPNICISKNSEAIAFDNHQKKLKLKSLKNGIVLNLNESPDFFLYRMIKITNVHKP